MTQRFDRHDMKELSQLWERFGKKTTEEALDMAIFAETYLLTHPGDHRTVMIKEKQAAYTRYAELQEHYTLFQQRFGNSPPTIRFATP